MDMKLKTGITKSILSNILAKLIHDKVGIDVHLNITDLEVRGDEDGRPLWFKVNVDGFVDTHDLANLLLKK